ncbi:hypothetical protein [Microvirga thermotolerans]|uniref:Lipoprotein n=1 Tax=Microvirga thermotolerans TaxID=2651334 RepID=A0A5P9JX58_9HYPH|nr:hypothetical protein [Microvirga thermotolerans]QFU15805.1 hypothetical protein GDR74_05970 [Microvirga thermotolerans]
MSGWKAKAGTALAALGLAALGGCGAPGDGGTSLGNMVLFAGPSVPPPQKKVVEDVYCPPVDIMEGGSAIQAFAGGRVGEQSGLRSQIAISNLARECLGQPDGSTVVKVGVEGRALLGAGGTAGRYDVPVQIVVKRGSTVIANRSRRVSVAIPAGDTQGTFAIVEEGIVVPAADATAFEIEVGLGGSGAPARRKRG